MQPYVLSDEQFRSLARGAGRPDALDLLVESQVSKRRLLLLAAIERLPPGHDDVLEVLARLDRSAPSAMRRLLRHPFLEAWFADFARQPDGPALGYLAGLAAAAAILGGIDFELTLPNASTDLVLPMLGRLVGVGGGPVRLGYDGTELRAPVSWSPQADLSGMPVVMDDVDPYRGRFSEPPLDRVPPGFAAVIEDGWHLLAADLPGHAAEIRTTLAAVVPLRPPANGSHASASARGTFGAIGMSPVQDAEVVAELLVHESRHDVLGALLDLVELCRPGGPARYYAPWRPDPRPAEALMQGIYAFAGVAGFWLARRRHSGHPRAEHLFALWRDQVSCALAQLLGSGELTDLGERFFTEVNGAIEGWRAEPVSPAAAESARVAAQATRARWESANGPVRAGA